FGEDNESVTNSCTMAKAIVSEIIKPSSEKSVSQWLMLNSLNKRATFL
ncbi:hypothetical protein HMPREF0555_0104, partial [Leuconostoc mesenteroides subsp. cremoris ATCC 19254]